jgi:hypothetical protein
MKPNCLAGLLLLALSVLACGRKQAAHTPARATGHLPAACQAVARVDFQSVIRAPGVEQHLLAHHADDKTKSVSDDSKSHGDGKIFEFLQEAGIDPKQNVKEVAVCLSDSVGGAKASRQRASFLIAIGGDLGGTDLLPAMEKFAPKDAKFQSQTVDGQKVLSRNERLWAQAKDGVILFSDNLELLKLGLNGSHKHYESLDVPKANVGLVATRRIFETMGGQSAEHPHPLLQGLGAAERLTASLSFTDRRLEARLSTTSEGDAQALTDRWNQLLAPFRDVRGKSVLGKHLPQPFIEAVSSVSVQPREKGVDVKVQFPAAAFEQVFHMVALYSGLEASRVAMK